MHRNHTDPASPIRRLFTACRLDTSKHMPLVGNLATRLVIVGLTIAACRPPLKAMRDREMAELRDQISLDIGIDKRRGSPSQVIDDIDECRQLKDAMEKPSARNRVGLIIFGMEAGDIGLAAQYSGLIGPRRDGKFNLKCDG